MHQHTMEILAPAGGEDCLRAAVYSGADCVYLGVDGFNARRSAANFSGETLARAVAFCHARNCRVYAAMNTIAFPGQQQSLQKAIEDVRQAGCDAVIVQDLGTAQMVRQFAPGLPLHASTQMSIHSVAGAQQLERMGFSRVILARELAQKEIAEIAEKTQIELEVFVHGALCVGVSGQCYLSAFLGGRSANRGGCAGPCRLPFRAEMQSGEFGDAEKNIPRAAADDCCHLSLKDLSILDALPELEKMGVVSAKIEGRLRGPEYCAVVVDSALKARAGQPYDKKLLRGVFSRSGFTSGWYTGTGGADMFGRRTEGDAAQAKAALPVARALYRRERARVPVDMQLHLAEQGGELLVSDGIETVRRSIQGPLPLAERDGGEMLRNTLQKTGGTPFYLQNLQLDTGGVYLAFSTVGQLRREALLELLELRQQPGYGAQPLAPPEVDTAVDVVKQNLRQPGALLRVRAFFEHVDGLPKEGASLCDELVLPLFEAKKVPPKLRGKTWLWIPRVLFGALEQKAADEIERVRNMGFLGFEANNLAHLKLCEGAPLWGGFGLNLSNAGAVRMAAENGCKKVTLSPELKLSQVRQIDRELEGEIPLDLLCYGHLPLMITRACPLRQITECDSCAKRGSMVDRKGERFPLVCKDGVRNIYNPVPLWMGERQDELPVDSATLYFTKETPKQAAEVLRAFRDKEKAPTRFTRGLYDRGVNEEREASKDGTEN